MFTVLQYELDEYGSVERKMFSSFVEQDCWDYVAGRYNASRIVDRPVSRLYVKNTNLDFVEEPEDIRAVRNYHFKAV